MIIKKSLIPICCIYLLVGCVQTETIENLQIAEGIGYDSADKKKYELTLDVAIFSTGKDKKVTNTTLSDVNFTGYGAARSAQNESPKPVTVGKVLVAVYGEELAKKGVIKILDGLKRHPSIGRMVDFCVIEGNAKELLEGTYAFEETPSRYLKNLLEHHKTGNLPSTNYHEFMYNYSSKGQDPFMVLVKKQNDKIKLSGLALFKEDKYIDAIRGDKLFLFKMLYEHIDYGTYEASFPEEDTYIALETIKSKVDYQIKKGMTSPEIEITVKAKAFINEVISDIKLQNAADERKLEKMIEAHLKESSLQMIKDFQEKGIDPLGFGDRVRSQTRGWKADKWRELYPDASVDVKIKFDIIEKGITE